MNKQPYQRFGQEQLILRDELAIDRTLLANERTLLAYARTGVALIVGGVTFLHFPERATLPVVGLVLIPVGTIIMWVGYHRFARMRDAIAIVRRGVTSRVADEVSRIADDV